MSTARGRRLRPGRRHRIFLSCLAAGVAVALAAAGPGALRPALAVLAGADAFFLAYLAAMLRQAARIAPADLRARAAERDEGTALILALAAAAVAVSFGAIFLIMNDARGLAAGGIALALLAVPLGWGMVQVLAAFHYAHIHFGPDPGRAGGVAGGLAFPGGGDPVASDFLYLAFGIGMTAQVSDVAVTSAAMRRAVLVHALAAFGYNTVIVALAVNALAVAAG